MNDVREILERGLGGFAPTDGLDPTLKKARRRQRKRRILAASVALIITVTGIGVAARSFSATEPKPPGSATPAQEDSEAELARIAGIYVAVIEELTRGHRSGRIFVIDHAAPDADAAAVQDESEPFSDELTTQIKRSIHEADIEFVPSREAVDEQQPDAPDGWTEIPDGILITLGPQGEVEDGRVLVGASSWRNMLAGYKATFVVELVAGRWRVTETRPISVS